MNPKHLHTPVSTRLRCPVCHQAVYSRGGIHPQCAMRQSEPPLPKPESQIDGSDGASAGALGDAHAAGTSVIAAKAPAHVKAPKFKIAIGAESARPAKSSV